MVIPFNSARFIAEAIHSVKNKPMPIGKLL
jgi:hypothetical protein